MDMSGEYRIAAPRQTVWVALNDPETLKQCIPGCEEIDKVSDTEFTAKVRAKVGPVSARFSGRVQLVDMDPPNGYRIVGEGTGGAAGFAKGGAKVALAEAGAETVLTYTAEAQVGGKLAQIGSRLIQGTAKKYADDFFGNFSRLVAGGGPALPATPAVTAPTPAPAASVQPEEQAARPMAPPSFPPAQPKSEPVPSAAPLPEVPVQPETAAILSGAGGDTAAVPTAVDSPAGLAHAEEDARTEAEASRPAATTGAPPFTAPPPPSSKGLHPVVWIGALVIIVVILLMIFS
jgi:uncharacterized protein